MAVVLRTSLLTLLLVALALWPCRDAHAQIELTVDEVRALTTGEISGFSTENAASLQALVEASGESQVYDITSVTFEQTLEGSIELMTMPADVPGADDPALSDAEAVLAYDFDVEGADLDSTAWVFHDFEDDGVYRHGIVFRSTVDLDGDGAAPDEVSLTFSPPEQSLALPLTFGTSWTSESTQTLSVGGTSIDNSVSLSAEVDGYGTLITPAGEASCLRVHRITETSSFGVTTTTESFEFITETGMNATITLDASGQVAAASYSVVGDEGTDVEQADAEMPDGFRLAQNYPNPFNPQTTIRYDVPEATPVRLAVYDMLGREVDVLVDRHHTAGTYEAVFEASRLPSGVYVYRLDAGSFTQTRRMLLLK